MAGVENDCPGALSTSRNTKVAQERVSMSGSGHVSVLPGQACGPLGTQLRLAHAILGSVKPTCKAERLCQGNALRSDTTNIITQFQTTVTKEEMARQ